MEYKKRKKTRRIIMETQNDEGQETTPKGWEEEKEE